MKKTVVFVLSVLTATLFSDTVTMASSGGWGAYHNDPARWSNNEAPSDVHDYLVASETIYTTAPGKDDSNYLFDGNSLTFGNVSKAGTTIILGPKFSVLNEGLKIYNWAINYNWGYSGNKNVETSVFSGKMQIFSDRAAPQIVLTYRSNGQHIYFENDITGDDKTGIKINSNEWSNDNTNCIAFFTGDLSNYRGYIEMVDGYPTSNNLGHVVLVLDSMTFPGTIKMSAGPKNFLRVADADDIVNAGKLNLTAGSAIECKLDLADFKCGAIKVANEFTMSAPVLVNVNISLPPDDINDTPRQKLPILTVPAGTDLNIDDFVISFSGDAGFMKEDYVSFAVENDAEGLPTLYVVIEEVVNPQGANLQNAVWTGALGSADKSLASAGNWAGAVTPDSAGKSIATFATGGEATVADAVVFNGIILKDNSFAFSSAAEDASLAVWGSGISVSGNGAMYNVNLPLGIYGNQKWSIAGGSTLTLNGPLSNAGRGVHKVYVDGGGDLKLNGSYAPFKSDLTISNVNVTVTGTNVFGSSGTPVVYYGDKSDETRKFSFGDCLVGRDVTVKAHNCERCLAITGDATFNGYLRYEGPSRTAVSSGKTFTMAGGAYFTQYFCPGGNGSILIAEKPITVLSTFQADIDITFAVSGNRCENDMGLNMRWSRAKKISLAAPNALTNTSYVGVALTMSGNTNLLDICGYDQIVGTITMDLNGTAVITNSGDAATLHVIQYSEQLRHDSGPAWITGDLRGPIFFIKDGEAALSVSNHVTAVGTLEVIKGRMRFFDCASWRNATDITVSGETAVLEVAANNTFNGDIAFELENGGTIEIPSGVTVNVLEFYIDGVKQSRGEWKNGSSYDAPGRRTPLIRGGGTVRVYSPGTVMILR